MNFVIIGGDAAGMSAASRAKRNRPDMNVTVLEMTLDVSYSACGMPYNIADPERSMDELVVRQAQVFREKQNIDLLVGHKVESLDRKKRIVAGRTMEGAGFERPYDKLLVATGASPVVPDLPGFDMPGVVTLKNLEDGRRIKALLDGKPVKKAVIVGMGYIALEMAEALRARGIDVDMVKPRPQFLPWLSSELAGVVRDEVVSRGARLFPGHELERIEADERGLEVVCRDLVLSGDMVLLAVGVKPNSGLAARAGIELGAGGAVAVDRRLKTSDGDIYAAGDCADAFHEVTGERDWIPLALRANRAGWAAADDVCGKGADVPGIVGTAVFKVFDLEVARTGLDMAEAKKAGRDPAEVTIQSRSRAHAHRGSTTMWVSMVGDRRSGRLLGAQMVGREGAAHRIDAAAVALHAGMTVEAFSRCDLAYAPPFSPVWDPMLTAANQLLKTMFA